MSKGIYALGPIVDYPLDNGYSVNLPYFDSVIGLRRKLEGIELGTHQICDWNGRTCILWGEYDYLWFLDTEGEVIIQYFYDTSYGGIFGGVICFRKDINEWGRVSDIKILPTDSVRFLNFVAENNIKIV